MENDEVKPGEAVEGSGGRVLMEDAPMGYSLLVERLKDADDVTIPGYVIVTARLWAEVVRQTDAAPELYEALKKAQRAIVALTRALPQGEALADYVMVLDEAESSDLAATAALAHARGEK